MSFVNFCGWSALGTLGVSGVILLLIQPGSGVMRLFCIDFLSFLVGPYAGGSSAIDGRIFCLRFACLLAFLPARYCLRPGQELEL